MIYGISYEYILFTSYTSFLILCIFLTISFINIYLTGKEYTPDAVLCLTEWTKGVELEPACVAALPKKAEEKKKEQSAEVRYKVYTDNRTRVEFRYLNRMTVSVVKIHFNEIYVIFFLNGIQDN